LNSSEQAVFFISQISGSTKSGICIGNRQLSVLLGKDCHDWMRRKHVVKGIKVEPAEIEGDLKNLKLNP